MKEKEFERRLDKKIQSHAKIMSDEKRKKIHIDYAKNHSQNELFAVCIEEMSELTKHLTKIMRGKESMRNNAGCIEEMADVQICLNTLQLYLDLSESDLNDFVGDYTVFDLMILDANTYIAQLNFSYFILRTWKSKYHCKEVKYSLEEKGLL